MKTAPSYQQTMQRVKVGMIGLAAVVLLIGLEPVQPGIRLDGIAAAGSLVVAPLLTLQTSLDGTGSFMARAGMPAQDVRIFLQAVSLDFDMDATPIKVSQGVWAQFPFPGSNDTTDQG